MEKSVYWSRMKYLLCPILPILPCWFFLFLWTPPFCFATASFSVASDAILDQKYSFCYAVLIIVILLNLGNAAILLRRSDFEKLQSALLAVRIVSLVTYPALIWGQLLSILFLMGPDRNQHIFLLIAFSFPALNLSGAFYGVPLVIQLRKKRIIHMSATIFYIAAEFIIGVDILATFLLRKKLKILCSSSLTSIIFFQK